ncbi:UNVERIFIED_CONTAM: hypothetical protein GTU68_032753 [Idotea baltica]|nr:hypothetical protein [Idotea baltica]
MCGIVAYIGKREAYPIILNGLKRLEYRGYDSAGVALLNGNLNVYKKAGKVGELEKFVIDKDKKGCLGIGHTRWATHGAPNDTNAHPHCSEDCRLTLVHNGIIENYDTIKKELLARGHTFLSDTDTEVLVHLIDDIQQNTKVELEEAVRLALTQVTGAYAIVVISQDEPNKIVCARKSSPLVVGIGKEEYVIASDATPIIEYTRKVVYLDDEEVAVIDREQGLRIKDLDNEHKTPYVTELEWQLERLEKGGYEHFMLKEINEQPRSILDSFRGRIDLENNKIVLGGLQGIIIVACGTSWHAGLVGEYLIEDIAKIPVEVEYASEFRYRNPPIFEDDIVIAISQSGETADTLAAIKLAKEKGATIFGICNVVGSTISRETHTGTYTHAGPEIGVASTKAFTAQLTVLSLLALYMAKQRNSTELTTVPEYIEKALECEKQIKKIAKKYMDVSNFLYLGRGYNFPVALEGALKLKEISYIHAEGYPAAEMKHGPIALIDKNMPVVVVGTNKSAYEKIISNVQEVKARDGQIIAITNEGDDELDAIADHVIKVPSCAEQFSPMVATIPLQLLAYHIAVLRGCDIDQPRNLAKSVTVE